MQRTADYFNGNTLQHAPTRCNTLQHTATHCCNTLHDPVTHCNSLLWLQKHSLLTYASRRRVLQSPSINKLTNIAWVDWYWKYVDGQLMFSWWLAVSFYLSRLLGGEVMRARTSANDDSDVDMGWLRSVGSSKLYIFFAEYHLFYRALLQRRPIISRSPRIVATPYVDRTYSTPRTWWPPHHVPQATVCHGSMECDFHNRSTRLYFQHTWSGNRLTTHLFLVCFALVTLT